ncbi:hypothetical protein [Paracoccus laeviglucosivorans]|uniref:hypothetical protein n=1 Tax=Paracoccus laeviglucosivorans TaxID=1197861 RepID=UPI00163D43A2|nr:hypothetical protein [Paracoccus laeviglucosivorans]
MRPHPSKSGGDGKAFAVEPTRQAGTVMDIEIDESLHVGSITPVFSLRQLLAHEAVNSMSTADRYPALARQDMGLGQ